VNPGNHAAGERTRYEAKTAALAGRHVLAVRYWDVHRFTSSPRSWDHDDWHHAVMGVELRTDRGPWCVRWTSTFFPYGVEAFPTPMSEHLATGESGPESWDASESGAWQHRLGSLVTGVQTFWHRFTIGPGYRGNVQVSPAREVDIPVALRVGFAAGPVWMVAGNPQGPEMGNVFVPGNEIMVVFTPDRMRQIGFPPSEFLTAGPG
jgi:hypothetical protein